MVYVEKRSRKRLAIILLLVFVMFLGLLVQLFRIQIIKGKYYEDKAYKQQTKNRLITPTRGTIYDRTGTNKLALSVDTKILVAYPTKIDDEKKSDIAEKLAIITNTKSEEILANLNIKATSVDIAKRLSEEDGEILKTYINDNDLGVGLKIISKVTRVYPYETLLSHVLGFTGTDSQGLSGLENEYDIYLAGTPGKIVGSVDCGGNETPYENEQYIAPVDGYDLVLTVDEKIQSIVEKNLSKAIKDNLAKGGVCIVMRPSTGEVLAMATYPDYNPNEPFKVTNEETVKAWGTMTAEQKSEALNAMWRNTAVSDAFEPGSTFKVVTASAGLEENIVEMDTPNVFNCKGYMNISGWKISCWRYPARHGGESLRQAIVNSCNPALMQLVAKIGKEKYAKYLQGFNLYSTTGIDLPGEVSGIMHDPDNMTSLDLATNSFGQGIQISAIQTAVIYSAIANGGNIMVPYVVKEIKSTDGSVIEETEPIIRKQIISKETSDSLMSALYDTVEKGTGGAGKVNGYSVAGKSGTAEEGRGKNLWYMASFVGIAPVNDPEIVVLLNIYDPHGPNGHAGGAVCSPVVANIIEDTLGYLGVNPNYTVEESTVKEIVATSVISKTYAEAKKIIEREGFVIASDKVLKDTDIIAEQIPKAGASLSKGATIRVYTDTITAKATAKVPNVQGKSIVYATSLIRKAGLNIRIIGKGKAIIQDPGPKEVVTKGSIITVKFIDTTNIH